MLPKAHPARIIIESLSGYTDENGPDTLCLIGNASRHELSEAVDWFQHEPK